MSKNHLLYSILLAYTCSTVQASEISLKDAPSWITKPSQEETCALGIGSAKSDDPYAEAMIMSTLEHSLMESTKISSSTHIFQKDQDMNIRVTSKISGYTYGVGLKEKASWKNGQGDHFVLTCKDTSSSLNSFPFVITHYEEKSVSNKSIDHGRAFTLEVADQLLVKSTFTKPYPVSEQENPDRPVWLDSSYHYKKFSTAEADIIDNDIQTAYLEAMYNARHELAQTIMSVELPHKDVNKASQKPASDTEPSDTIKKVFLYTVEESRLNDLWLDEINQKLYVLLKVKDPVLIEEETQTANKLWEQFKTTNKEGK